MTAVPIGIRASGRTDVGLVRRTNEDAIVVSAPVFVVADGMGGHVSGADASGVVAEVFGALRKDRSIGEDDVRAALEIANRRIMGGHPGAGTTVVGLVLEDHEAIAFNVGDSRLYRLDGGVVAQLSRDDTVVQDLLDSGAIDGNEAKIHPGRHILTKAVGAEVQIDPSVWRLAVEPGDRFLLASDGLTGELDDDDIADLIPLASAPDECVERLLGAALSAGGHDNISAIIVDVVGTPTEVGEEADRDDTAPRVSGAKQ